MVKMYTGMETLVGKTVIVTGSNTGIGKETAKDLARRGGRVIMACRNLEKGEAARKEIMEETMNNDVVVRQLDLSSFSSIQKFAREFNNSESRLDILINNAGIMACPKTLTEDGLEMQMGTNHFGPFLLTELVLEKLKASAPSRIVNVSSVAHKWGKMNFDDLNSEKSYSSWGAYQMSKLANVLHCVELAKRLEGTGVTANSLHPGTVNTDLPRFMKQGISKYFLTPIIKLIAVSPKQGAQTSLHCALEPKLATVSGKYFDDCKEKQPSEAARDEAVAKKLWEVTEEIIQHKLGYTRM